MKKLIYLLIIVTTFVACEKEPVTPEKNLELIESFEITSLNGKRNFANYPFPFFDFNDGQDLNMDLIAKFFSQYDISGTLPWTSYSTPKQEVFVLKMKEIEYRDKWYEEIFIRNFYNIYGMIFTQDQVLEIILQEKLQKDCKNIFLIPNDSGSIALVVLYYDENDLLQIGVNKSVWTDNTNLYGPILLFTPIIDNLENELK